MKHVRFATLVALLAAAAFLAGCRDGGGDAAPTAEPTAPSEASALAPSPTPTPSPQPTLRGTPGCGRALPADLKPGETVSRVIQSANRTRTYLAYVPPAAGPASAPMALVLNFHGYGSNGAQQHIYAGLVPIAEREGFVVVSPNGLDNAWLLTAGLDDIQFVRDLVATLGQELCLDPARVYATGMSNGGFMSTTLACRAGDLVAAIAPVAGESSPGPACGSRAVPMIVFHGTGDAVVPYQPGPIQAGVFTGTPFAGVASVLRAWADRNGCSAGEPVETRVADDVVAVEYQDCTAPVVHYRIEGGGHTWPGAVAVPRLGKTTTSISASEVMWAFFVEHPLRP
ncbi:PHB depolymerase family esterase [Tepidiforma sp.]|uniref:alpha/beta hydrolase family esterase n=1 Tax=Tepidiforma sp. TaxID=2682230 RepID=UPI002ADD4E68|nr:PHB depolymerase family esterase [Tepidiforma sp.]